VVGCFFFLRDWDTMVAAARAETPLARPIQLKEGTHTVRFEHDWYQPVERTVEIVEGVDTAPKAVAVDFEAERLPLAAGKAVPASRGPR
jgi:hypothetical protein